MTVLCCGEQRPGGGELKTQTVFNGQLCPRGRTERPVACPTSLSAHRSDSFESSEGAKSKYLLKVIIHRSIYRIAR